MKDQDYAGNYPNDLNFLFNLLKNMTDTMPDMLWAKDMEGNFTFVNKGICTKLLNAKNTLEPVGKDVMFFVNRERESHKDDPDWFTFGEECFDSDSEVIKSGKLGRFDEYGNVFGEFLYLDVYKAPLYDENKKMIGTVGSARDITKEKQIERKLFENEEKYRTIVENSNDGIFIYRDSNLIFINKRISELSGYTKEELLKMNIWDLVHNDDKERLKEFAAKRTKGVGSVPDNYTAKLLGKKDDVHYCEFSVSKIIMDEKPAVIGVVKDITEEVKSKEKIRKSEEDLRSLFKSMKDFVFEINIDGRFMFIAPTSPENVYMPFDKAINKKIIDVFPKPMADKFMKKITKCLKENQTQDIVYELNFNNKTFWYNANVSVKTEKSVLIIVRDITPQKIAEDKLLLNKQDLEKKVELRTEELRKEKTRIEEINELFVGREMKMMELKKENEELKEKINYLEKNNK